MFRKLTAFLLILLGATAGSSAVYHSAYANSPSDYTYVLSSPLGTMGSGVVIAPNTIATVCHVAEATTVVEYKGSLIPFVVQRCDKEQDIALVTAEGVACPCADVQLTAPDVGTKVIKYGFGLYPSWHIANMTEGFYMGLVQTDDHLIKFLFTAPVAPGDSGSGIYVLTWTGYKLIGLVSAVSTWDYGMTTVFFPHMAIGIPISVL